MALIVMAVIILFVSDIVLGVMKAIKRGVFSSRGFSRVLEKTVVYTLAIAGMTAFGVIVPAIPFASGVVIPTEVVVASARGFFIWTLLLIGLTEFISIIENLKCLGFRMPKQVYRLIEEVKKRIGQAVPGVEVEDNGEE